MIDKENKEEYEKFAKDNNIEIITLCRNCGVVWVTLEEWKVIIKCEKCGETSNLDWYMRPCDVVEAIKRIKEKEEEIRNQIGQMAHQLHWLERTSRLSAPLIPDFDYFWKEYIKLIDMAKIDIDGRLKKQDKRGSWR